MCPPKLPSHTIRLDNVQRQSERKYCITWHARPCAASLGRRVASRLNRGGGVQLRAGRPGVHAGQLESDPLDLVHRGLLLLRSRRRRRRRGTPVAPVAPALGFRDDAQARVPLGEDAAVREAARDVVLRCPVHEVVGLCLVSRRLARRLVFHRLALGRGGGAAERVHRQWFGRWRLARWRWPMGLGEALGEVEGHGGMPPPVLQSRRVVGLRGGKLGVEAADDHVLAVLLHTRRPPPRRALADATVHRGA
eukprot:scaffold31003_cov66-Phaeocystis_antarctica.AAC.5